MDTGPSVPWATAARPQEGRCDPTEPGGLGVSLAAAALSTPGQPPGRTPERAAPFLT